MSRLWSRLLSRLVSPGLAALAMLVLLAPAAANATPYVVKLKQQGTNVVAIGSGALDLTGLSRLYEGDETNSSMHPNGGFLGSSATSVDDYSGFTGPANFGSGGASLWSSASGDNVGILAAGYPVINFPPVLFVPHGYSSGTALFGSLTWLNASFAGLGVTPGTYVWTWGTGAEQSYTLRIAVPEPATLAMFGFGLLLVGTFVGLRRRVA